MKSRTKQSLMKRVNSQSSSATCKPFDTGTSYQLLHRTIWQKLSIAFLSDRFKSGQRLSVQNRPTEVARHRTKLFYPAASCRGKSVLVRQLRGPHLSTCPWCSRRSSMPLTAAATPQQLAPVFYRRLEVSMMLARS
jgi:hypothetical protein